MIGLVDLSMEKAYQSSVGVHLQQGATLATPDAETWFSVCRGG